jgi:tetratricopeptide (TPR) repeat protein
MVDAYRRVVDDPAAHESVGRQLVWGIARMLTDSGYPTEALGLHRYLVEQARLAPAGESEGPGGDARLRAALVNLGAALWTQGDLASAQPLLAEAVDRCRGAGDESMLSIALGDLAIVRRDQGALDEAAGLFTEEERLCRELADTNGLQASLGNHAQLLRQQGRYDEALTLIGEQEQLCRDAADRAGVSRALAAKATVLADRGDVAEALALTVEHGETSRQLGDLRGLAESLLNQTVMRSQVGHVDAALATAAEGEELARRLADPGLLARLLVAHAMAVSSTGNWAEAERVAREGELTAREAGTFPQVALALGIVGTARREHGDLAGCRATHEEELRVASATNDPQAIATAHTNLGNVDIAENRLADALGRYAQAEPLFRQHQAFSSLLPLLANRGQIHQMQQNFPAAVADYADAADAAARLGIAASAKQWGEMGIQLAYQVGDTVRAESLWGSLAMAYRAEGDEASLQRALGERALMMINRAQPQAVPGDPPNVDQALLAAAAPLLDEQEAICRRLGDQVGLAACIGNRAIVLRYQGDLGGALTCVDEQLRIAQASNNAQGVLFATANRGELLGLLGRVPEALEALTWARQTAAQYGPQLQPMVQQLDQMIAGLQQRN